MINPPMHPRYLIQFHLIAVLSMLLGCLVPQAAWAIPLKPDDGIDAPVSLSGELAILRDPTGALTIDDIVSRDAEFEFDPIPSMLTEGYRKGAIWVRFTLSAPGPVHQWFLQIERPLIEQVNLYVSDGAGGFAESAPGRRHAGDDIVAETYPSIFPISVPSTATEYYIRLQSSTSITTALNLWQEEGWEDHRRSDDWIIGIVVGAIGVMIFVNLLFFAWIKDRTYILYTIVLFVSGFIPIFHMGYSPEVLKYFDPQAIHRIWGIVVCLYSIVMITFLLRIFEFSHRDVWSSRFLKGIIFLNFLSLLFAIAGRYGDVGLLVSRLQQVAFAFIALVVLYLLFARRQYQYALPAIAFALVVAVSLVMQMQYTGTNPFEIDGSLARVMTLGTLIHLVLLSAAVAERTRVAERNLGREKDRVLAISRSAERDLSIKVRERTAELAETNASLKAEVERRLVLEGKLRQSLASVNDALAQQRDFVALVTHEFRAPLAVIAAAAENLSLFASDRASGVKVRAAKIRRTVRRMSMLIENVLAGERLDASPMPPGRMAPFDLNEILQAIQSSLDDGAAARMEFLYGDQAVVMGDRDLLEIAVQNLIQNALKYSGETDPVTVHLWTDQRLVFVEVVDRGAGVPADDREHIFMKFYRAAGQQGVGSGLGLYIARALARRHGGDLILAESGAEGSRFRLSLPLAESEAGFEPVILDGVH